MAETPSAFPARSVDDLMVEKPGLTVKDGRESAFSRQPGRGRPPSGLPGEGQSSASSWTVPSCSGSCSAVARSSCSAAWSSGFSASTASSVSRCSACSVWRWGPDRLVVPPGPPRPGCPHRRRPSPKQPDDLSRFPFP